MSQSTGLQELEGKISHLLDLPNNLTINQKLRPWEGFSSLEGWFGPPWAPGSGDASVSSLRTPLKIHNSGSVSFMTEARTGGSCGCPGWEYKMFRESCSSWAAQHCRYYPHVTTLIKFNYYFIKVEILLLQLHWLHFKESIVITWAGCYHSGPCRLRTFPSL